MGHLIEKEVSKTSQSTEYSSHDLAHSRSYHSLLKEGICPLCIFLGNGYYETVTMQQLILCNSSQSFLFLVSEPLTIEVVAMLLEVWNHTQVSQHFFKIYWGVQCPPWPPLAHATGFINSYFNCARSMI